MRLPSPSRRSTVTARPAIRLREPRQGEEARAGEEGAQRRKRSGADAGKERKGGSAAHGAGRGARGAGGGARRRLRAEGLVGSGGARPKTCGRAGVFAPGAG